MVTFFLFYGGKRRDAEQRFLAIQGVPQYKSVTFPQKKPQTALLVLISGKLNMTILQHEIKKKTKGRAAKC